MFVDAPGSIAEEVRIVTVDQHWEGYYVVCLQTVKPVDQAVLESMREEVVAFAESGAEGSCSSRSLGTRAHPMSGV